MKYALLALSAILAIAYGAYGSSLYEGDPPFVVGTIFKASSIVILGLIALLARSNLLAAGLLFGALGDALLAWSQETFLYGAFAFLIGHLFYIALWLRAGIGVGDALKQPPRLLGAVALIIACIAMEPTPTCQQERLIEIATPAQCAMRARPPARTSQTRMISPSIVPTNILVFFAASVARIQSISPSTVRPSMPFSSQRSSTGCCSSSNRA